MNGTDVKYGRFKKIRFEISVESLQYGKILAPLEVSSIMLGQHVKTLMYVVCLTYDA